MTHFNALTDVLGFQVGHWSNRKAATGYTVALCSQGAVAGLGSASKLCGDGTVVAALAVVNALGEVFCPQTQQVLAGARNAKSDGFADSTLLAEQTLSRGEDVRFTNENTTLAVVATNATLTKASATKVAEIAHDGLARVIRSVHLPH